MTLSVELIWPHFLSKMPLRKGKVFLPASVSSQNWLVLSWHDSCSKGSQETGEHSRMGDLEMELTSVLDAMEWHSVLKGFMTEFNDQG